ncbi:hypothetical protein HY797_03535 [Candidatus Falkowbacteria bacterium]|nr:hypothetical protein [Candidatus Falkowbacteria bacterium]
MKKIIFSLLLIIFLLGLAGCAKKNNGIIINPDNKNQVRQEESASIKGDVSNDICIEFSADFVYSVTGKPVVKVEPDIMAPKFACRYYFTYDEHFYKGVDNPKLSAGGAHIFMMLENLNIADQKKGIESLGATTKSDYRIKTDNMITVRENGTIWDIKLIINPNRYVKINYSNGALTDEQLIDFAAKIAEKIQGNLSFNIKSNPVNSEEQRPEEAGESQRSVASNFLDNLSNLKIQESLAMMDVNDNAKQSWGVNFNTIVSLKVNKIEEAFKEEWTATRQTFKVELDVKVKPEGEQVGWRNGTNYRWVTLEKNASGTWLIHEIANNP